MPNDATPLSPMSLAEITEAYLDLYRQRARQADFDRAEGAFQRALSRVRQPEEIRAALRLDKGRRLPVQLKSPAYERLLTLSGRTVRLLREYAQEMYDYGPEWTPYADLLWDEAKQRERDEQRQRERE